MQKIIIMLLLISITIGFYNSPVSAQQTHDLDVAGIQAAWVHEPALNQADIDTYMQIWPQMIDLARQKFDKESFIPVFEKVGWSIIHGSYVLAKINMTLLILENPELEVKLSRSMPLNAVPTRDEMELVKQNQTIINAQQQTYLEKVITE